MRKSRSCLHVFISVRAAHYLMGETERAAMIISKAADEVTEPFEVGFPFVMGNYRGLFTVFFFFFAF